METEAAREVSTKEYGPTHCHPQHEIKLNVTPEGWTSNFDVGSLLCKPSATVGSSTVGSSSFRSVMLILFLRQHANLDIPYTSFFVTMHGRGW